MKKPVLIALAALIGLAACKPKPAALDPDDKKPEIVAADRILPAALAEALAEDDKPSIVHIGIKVLYDEGHVPGTVYAGEGASPAGLKAMETALQGLPRDKETVIYCGCCPWEHCPNIVPAYKKLKELGFKDVKVMKMDHDFDTDWAKPGFPTEKSPKKK